MSVDIKKVVSYPPEAFIGAGPTDLLSGTTTLASYVSIDPYVITISGLSFDNTKSITVHVDADGFTDVQRFDSTLGTRGLDYEEDAKIAVTKNAKIYTTSSSAVSAYQWRHRVVVFEPTVAMKLQLGIRLSASEVDLATKFGLAQALQARVPEPFKLDYGIEEVREIAFSATSSSTIARVVVPNGKKIIILGISATRPSAQAQAYLSIIRDNIQVENIDLYTLPSVPYLAPLRIVSLDKFEVDLNVLGAGTYNGRIVYGIGRFTLEDKVRWMPDALTAAERKTAEQLDLFDKVEAGVQ